MGRGGNEGAEHVPPGLAAAREGGEAGEAGVTVSLAKPKRNRTVSSLYSVPYPYRIQLKVQLR